MLTKAVCGLALVGGVLSFLGLVVDDYAKIEAGTHGSQHLHIFDFETLCVTSREACKSSLQAAIALAACGICVAMLFVGAVAMRHISGVALGALASACVCASIALVSGTVQKGWVGVTYAGKYAFDLGDPQVSFVFMWLAFLAYLLATVVCFTGRKQEKYKL